MAKDYYNILGVDKSATADEIKRAFRKEAHKHHPDKENGNEAKFKEVNEAYQVLSDGQKRSQYDQFGTTFDGAGAQYSNMNWQEYAGNFSDIFSSFGGNSFGDAFADIFGGARAQRRSRGHDIEAQVEIDLRDAVFGIEKKLKLTRHNKCAHCSGQGNEPGTDQVTCPQCQGQGSVQTAHRTILGDIMQQSACPTCRGVGQKPEKYCTKCHGEGRTRGTSTINLKIPAGIADSQSIRLSGQGDAGVQAITAGDLYVVVRVKPDEQFERVGDDLLTMLPVSFATAALGAEVQVSTLDGEVKLKIPAGTQPGQRFRLKGKGVTHLGHKDRGDLYVEAQVKVPKKLTRKQKQILEGLSI